MDQLVKKPNELVQEIVRALQSIRGWGSVEIFVQDHKVTQITQRSIKKANHCITAVEEEVQAAP